MRFVPRPIVVLAKLLLIRCVDDDRLFVTAMAILTATFVSATIVSVSWELTREPTMEVRP